MSDKVRVLFVTDLHGSRRSFLKFLNASKIYKATVGIIGGDLTGKVMIPIIQQPDGTKTTEFNGRNYSFTSDSSLKEISTSIQDSGYYPLVTTPEEAHEINTDPKLGDKLLRKLAEERLKEWFQLAAERLRGTNIKVFVTGGNDDYMEIDSLLASSDSMIYAESHVERLESGHEMISTGFSNITPWKCPRDITEDELFGRIESMAKQITNMNLAIFNLHVPPFDSLLDRCTKLTLSEDGVPKPVIGEETSGGSTAVRKAIETFQPFISLHGHIHESRGVDKIGKTLCFNPGSEYSEGVLRSVVINLHKDKLESYQFLSA